MHKISEFYKKIYLISHKIPKKDRFGIWLKTENICLETISQIIASALETKENKLPILNSARIKIDVLKRLVQITHELNIIEKKKYIDLESDLQEASKMINGWIKYLK